MEKNEYLVFIIWCISVFVLYKIFKRISQAFTFNNTEINDFFDSYGGKSC